jgi:hypothetical protein
MTRKDLPTAQEIRSRLDPRTVPPPAPSDLLVLYGRLLTQHMQSSGDEKDLNFRLMSWVGDLIAAEHFRMPALPS